MLLHERSDVQLRMLVEMVNRSDDMRIPIVLNTGGVVVIGAIGSARAYWNHIGVEFRKALATAKDEYHQIVEANFRQIGEAAVSGNDDESDEDPERPRFACVHVRDATVHIPTGYTYKTAWWRTKIAAVDGFSLALDEEVKLNQVFWTPPQLP